MARCNCRRLLNAHLVFHLTSVFAAHKTLPRRLQQLLQWYFYSGWLSPIIHLSIHNLATLPPPRLFLSKPSHSFYIFHTCRRWPRCLLVGFCFRTGSSWIRCSSFLLGSSSFLSLLSCLFVLGHPLSCRQPLAILSEWVLRFSAFQVRQPSEVLPFLSPPVSKKGRSSKFLTDLINMWIFRNLKNLLQSHEFAIAKRPPAPYC